MGDKNHAPYQMVPTIDSILRARLPSCQGPEPCREYNLLGSRRRLCTIIKVAHEAFPGRLFWHEPLVHGRFLADASIIPHHLTGVYKPKRINELRILTYAHSLVEVVEKDNIAFGAASDGDGDHNVIYGKGAFITPSDSVAIIADWAESIPYSKKGGVKGLARSMPTSAAIDLFARGFEHFEAPTGKIPCLEGRR